MSDAAPSEPTRAERFQPLEADAARRWAKFGAWEREFFPTLLGIVVEEVRLDYCRLRLPFKHSLEQAQGLVHGGAIASLLDHAVVPAVGSAYPSEQRYSTVDMHVQYLSALMGEDGIAEGWVVKRGRSTVFCESEVVGATSGKLIAKAVLTYNVAPLKI